VVETRGIPLTTTTTGAQRHDVTQLTFLVDRIPPVRGKRGRPRRRPKQLQGDQAYDSEPHRRALRRRGIQPVLARRRTPHGSGRGKHRWVVERTLSWLHQHGRLRPPLFKLPPSLTHSFQPLLINQAAAQME
jgi:transposase